MGIFLTMCSFLWLRFRVLLTMSISTLHICTFYGPPLVRPFEYRAKSWGLLCAIGRAGCEQVSGRLTHVAQGYTLLRSFRGQEKSTNAGSTAAPLLQFTMSCTSSQTCCRIRIKPRAGTKHRLTIVAEPTFYISKSYFFSNTVFVMEVMLL